MFELGRVFTQSKPYMLTAGVDLGGGGRGGGDWWAIKNALIQSEKRCIL